MALEDLSQMQRYLGEEMIDQARSGAITRRDMMVRLVAICGSATTAAALLAACGSNNVGPAVTRPDAPATTSSPGASGTAAPTTTAATTASTVVSPPTTTGAGAVLSVAATDPAVRGQDLTFKGPASSTMLGYDAVPAGGGRTAGVVVIHENRGLTDHIRDVARRLAKAGYHALAVDLASRQGGTAKVDPNNIAAVLSGLTPAQVGDDLDAAASQLAAANDANGKLGIVGFCFGGGITLQYAARNKNLAAAVPYYGPTPDPASQMANTNAAILAHYGATDARVNATIDALESTLRAAGKTFEKRIWDGAGHAFNNDTGGAYNQTAAVSAWGVTLSWFAKYLATT